jgi:hypothetical protein
MRIGSMTDMASLTSRIERLEDLEAIRQLVARYSQLCDEGYNPDGLADLFTEDAYWASISADGKVGLGECHSREQIRTFFAGVSAKLGPMTLHYAMTPSLQVSGETAKGRWYSLVPATMKTRSAPSGEAVLIGSTSEHEYRKVNGAWKFSRIVTTPRFRSPISKGWVEVPFVS